MNRPLPPEPFFILWIVAWRSRPPAVPRTRAVQALCNGLDAFRGDSGGLMGAAIQKANSTREERSVSLTSATGAGTRQGAPEPLRSSMRCLGEGPRHLRQGKSDGNKGQTLGNSGQLPGNREQTLGNREQMLGNNGQMLGNNGQTAGTNGQTAGTNGQMLGNTGQMRRNKGQTLGNKGPALRTGCQT